MRVVQPPRTNLEVWREIEQLEESGDPTWGSAHARYTSPGFRHETFRIISNSTFYLDSIELALHGWTYTGKAGRLRCEWCRLVVETMDPNFHLGSLLQFHKEKSPACLQYWKKNFPGGKKMPVN